MTAISSTKLSPEQYLAKERKNIKAIGGKHEYINGNIIEMTGASLNHNRISSNLHGLLWQHLNNKQFEVFQNDLRVHNIEKNSFFYPDIIVIKDEASFTDDHFDTITNPYMIIEVLSQSTEGYDRGEKFQQYRGIPSLNEYVLVSQEYPGVEVFYKNKPDSWILKDAYHLNKEIHFNTVNLTLQLSQIYSRVRWD